MDQLMDAPHIEARFRAVRQLEWPGAGNFRINEDASKVRHLDYNNEMKFKKINHTKKWLIAKTSVTVFSTGS